MARSFEIEALNLEMGFPAKKKFCFHKYGLLSEPDFALRTFGNAENLRNASQTDLRRENYSFVSGLLTNLVDSISSSKVETPEKFWNISPYRADEHVDNPETQSFCNIDFQEMEMGIGNKISQQISTFNPGNDHLVPEDESKWEDDQESIDDLWNEMSSSQHNGISIQKLRKSTNLTASIPPNDDGSRHSQNESDEFNFSLSDPSSQGEFDGLNDMFSQVFKKNLQSKKKNAMHFGKARPPPGSQVLAQSRPSSETMARPCSHQVVCSQNDRYKDLQRIFEMELEKTPSVKQEDEKEIDKDGFTTPKSQLMYSLKKDVPDLYENVTYLVDAGSPIAKLDVSQEEKGVGNFATQTCKSRVSSSQDAIDSANESPAAMSDIFDEEIDAAIANYKNTPEEVLEMGYASFHASSEHGKSLDLAKPTEEKINVATQTIISGSIYSSLRYNRIEQRPALKRSLQALCLENTVFKKPKTIFLWSPIHSPKEQSTEKINEFVKSPKCGDNGEVPQHLRAMKPPSASPPAFNCENDESFWVKEKPNQKVDSNDELEQDGAQDETEPSDQEVPRNIVTIGALPIQAPANFCWENELQASDGNYDDDTVDDGTLTKSKPQRRLRLGLSRLSKPRVSLHRFL